MRRDCLKVAALLVPTGFSLAAIANAEAADAKRAELLRNPGFQQWSEGRFTHWHGVSTGMATEVDDVRSGRRSLRLNAAGSGDHFFADVSQPGLITLRPNTLFLASVWAKGSGRLRIQLGEHKDRKYLGGKSSNHIDLTSDWTRYRFYYGTPEGRVDRVRFRVSIDGKGAVAFLDDASFVPLGPCQVGENVVSNGDMETDDDGDGCPDGWSSRHVLTSKNDMKRKDFAEPLGADGSQSLLASAAFLPDRAKESFAPQTWWSYASQPPPAPSFAVPASSPTFPVEPGRTYDVSFQTRGQNVRIFHVKLVWLHRDGTQVPRNHVFRLRRDGTWPWEEVRTRITAPSARVESARIQFWCRAGGGRLWIDKLSVRPSCLAEGWTVETHEVVPFETRAPTGEETRLPVAARKPLAYSVPPQTKTRVAKDADSLMVTLRNGVTLQFRIESDRLYGIGQLALGDLPFRNPGGPPIAPLVDSINGGEYQSCRYESHDVADDGTVTIRTCLTSADAHPISLDWVFVPIKRCIAGKQYAGLGYRYVLKSDGDRIRQLVDRTTWELGGRALGLNVITQNAYSVENEFTITANNTECPHAGTRFAHGDGLDYQTGPEGGLVVFYDERIPFVINTRKASTDWIASRDAIQYADTDTVQTPLKCVLFCEEGSHDEWTRLRDYVYGRQAKLWGIRQHTPMPIANCWMHWKDLAAEGDRVLRNIADNDAPLLGKLGFKVLVVHGIWGRGACAPDVLQVGSKFGGTDALRYLCQKAAEHGMTVQAWSSTAHLWRYSPLFEKNPEWIMSGPDGKPANGGYFDLRGTRFAKGWADYALDRYGTIRRETGLDSLWLDSYSTFSHAPRYADPSVRIEQAEQVFRYHAKLSQLGYQVYVEGTGSLGIPACGFPVGNMDSANPTLPPPHTRYGLTNYVGDDEITNRLLAQDDYYYRLLANKAPVMLYWRHLKNMPESHQKVAQANKDYNAVVDSMVYRRTLPEDRGVEWANSDDDALVVFSYRRFRYRCLEEVKVQDITAGRQVPLVDGGFLAEPMHTYRIIRKP